MKPYTIIMTPTKTGNFEVAYKKSKSSRKTPFTIESNPKKWPAKVVAALPGLEPGSKNAYVEDGTLTWRVSVQAV